MAAKRRIRIFGKPTSRRGALALTVPFDRAALKITESPFGVVLNLDDGFLVGKPGTPGFPMQTMRVALPAFSDITAIKTKIAKKVAATKTPVFVAPLQEPQPGAIRPTGQGTLKPSLRKVERGEIPRPPYATVPRRVTLPHLQDYQRMLAEPAPIARISAIDHRGVATIVTLELCPVRQTASGTIELATEIGITLTYEPAEAPKKNGFFAGNRDFRRPRTNREARLVTKILKAEVLNPAWIEDIIDFFPPFFAKYDYIVITDNQKWDGASIAPVGPAGDLVGAFQPLIDWKRRRGLRARVVSVTSIVNNSFGDFKTGARDLQEVLRTFIKWAYAHWDVSWVLLGGDVDIVPERLVAARCRGDIGLGTNDPPDDNQSFWTGAYLKMHVVNAGDWWPGDWPLLLVNPATGELIPFDSTGTSSAASPGWYYTTNNTYAVRTAGPTEFVRVNGPSALANATLQWLYRWNRIPSDLYYSSLVGPNYDVAGHHDWDLIDNGLYGQHTDSADLDGVDFAADVGLGRAPVSSVAEAAAFVNKVIAYEQFRRPDGTPLNANWPRRLAVASSNWGGRIGIWPVGTTPPGDNKYHHAGSDLFSLIKLKDTFSDMLWRLFSFVSQTDIRTLPYDADAANSGRGWYFAVSDTDLAVSEIVISIYGVVIRYPVPTQWVVAYGYSDEVAPQYFVFDRTEADGSMSDQEELRKQIAADLPAIDTVKRLYEDEVDLPAADAATPPVDHLTDTRLRDTLNLGQHFVSLSGHGSQGGVCGLGGAMATNLTNGYHTFIAYADSCLTNDFEYDDAMSEALLKNANGGAVGYIGNTRFSWIGVGDDFQREFFKRLKTTRHLALLNDSRFNLPNDWQYYKWIKFSLNLLGDPEMPVWVGKPLTMKVSHPAKVAKVDQHLIVTVTKSSGGAIEGAVVSLAMGSWVVSATTDASGQADLHIKPTATGTMEVVATASDFVPYFGSIEVQEPATCKTAIVCKAPIGCSAAILCQSNITCGSSVLCGPTIACGPAISCGTQIVPCGAKIACNFSISGCKAGIGPGCPAIDPVPWEDLFDIFAKAGVKDIQELAAKRNTPAVRKVIEMLSPVNRRALTLMLERIVRP